MRRSFALVFLFLYLYNIAGYLAVFSVLQYRIRTEVKKMIKESVPQSELIQFAFYTSSLERGDYHLQWTKENEFRHAGSMYDIVRSHISGDSTYFLCVNDVQEDHLFASLDSHVQRHMGDSGLAGKFDSFKNVFQDSYISRPPQSEVQEPTGKIIVRPLDKYVSVDRDVPFLPPRFLSPTA